MLRDSQPKRFISIWNAGNFNLPRPPPSRFAIRANSACTLRRSKPSAGPADDEPWDMERRSARALPDVPFSASRCLSSTISRSASSIRAVL